MHGERHLVPAAWQFQPVDDMTPVCWITARDSGVKSSSSTWSFPGVILPSVVIAWYASSIGSPGPRHEVGAAQLRTDQDRPFAVRTLEG
jgi:hypothetical protein